MNNTFRKLFYTLLGKIFKNKPIDVPIKVNKNSKILIFRYDKIGDMVVSLPSFELLRYHFPKAEIWVLASPTNNFLLNNYQYITKSVLFPNDFLGRLGTILFLRKVNFDVIINYVFYKTTKAGIIANLINNKAIKVNIGHNTRNDIYLKLFNSLFPITQRGKIPMAELLCIYICWLFGISFDREFLKKYNFYIPLESIKIAKNFVKKFSGQKILLVNISARRKWSQEHYIRLIAKLNNEFPNLAIVFVSHPKDANILSQIVRGQDRNVFTFVSDKTFYDVISLISLVDIVFSPDTSIVHFANAFGKPIVMMYSEKDSHLKEWLPCNSKFIGYISKNSKDNNDISPEQIFGSVRTLLNEK